MTQTTKTILLSILCSVAVMFTLANWMGWDRHESTAAAKQESVYDRVMRTGTIRCGYGVWPLWFEKDPNTGAMSGIFHDYVEELGSSLNLKIEWVEEVAWSAYAEALNSNRIDLMCVGIWQNSSRAKASDFTIPIFYNAVHAYTKTNDTRFDNNLSAINEPNIRISTIDGEMASIIAKTDFPLAKTLSLPMNADSSQMFLNVVTGKADVTFIGPDSIFEFNSNNKEGLRQVLTDKPLRLFGTTLALAQSQDRFRRMVDSATIELIQSGRIDAILNKYEKYPGSFYRVAKPYQLPVSVQP